MKKKIYCLRYILCFVLFSVCHIVDVSATNVDQTYKTDRLTILQQLLNNVGGKVTENELKIELVSIAIKYTEKAGKSTNIIGVLKMNSAIKILDDAKAGYVNKKLKSCINDEIKKEERLLPLKQKASQVAELEKELEKYSGQRIYNRQSTLKLLMGYSDKDVASEYKRLEKAEEALKIKVEDAKNTYEKKEKLFLDVKQKASRVAELEKELGKYIPENNIPQRSKLQLFAGYSYNDVTSECKRLEQAEETLKIEIENAKAAYEEQEQRKSKLLLRAQAIADTITIVKDSVRKHLNDKTWDKGLDYEKIVYDDKIRLARHCKEKDVLDEIDRLQSVKDKLSAYMQTLLDEENRIKRKEMLVDSVYSATGGKLKKYDGGYNGADASYSYIELPDGERIMHGLFHLKDRRIGEAGLIDGKFDKGKRTGTWTFRVPSYKLFVTYKKGKLQSITCKYKEKPTPLIALTFRNGEINGYAKNFDVYPSITQSNIAFGNVKQTVKFPENEDIIRCAFNADGYPDGLWTKEKTDDNRNRLRIQELYEHGVLKKVTHTDLSVTGKRTEIPLKTVYKIYLVSTEVCETLHSLFSYFEDYRLKIPGAVTYKMRKVRIAKEEKLPTEGSVHTRVESMPEFPGGDEALYKFIHDNTRKDLQTGNNSVYVQFTVNHDGSLTDIKTRGNTENKVLAEEAVKIVKAMPKWLPGMQNGETLRVKLILKIDF